MFRISLEIRDISEIFWILLDEEIFSFDNYGLLLRIFEKYVEEETRVERKAYEAAVMDYRLTKRLTDWIKTRELYKKDSGIFLQLQTVSHCTEEFKAKLHPFIFTNETLKYIDDLWKSITKNLCLPPLNAVLCDIERGCICVTWVIRANISTRKLIVEHLPTNQQFLKENNIVQIVLSNEVGHKLK